MYIANSYFLCISSKFLNVDYENHERIDRFRHSVAAIMTWWKSLASWRPDGCNFVTLRMYLVSLRGFVWGLVLAEIEFFWFYLYMCNVVICFIFKSSFYWKKYLRTWVFASFCQCIDGSKDMKINSEGRVWVPKSQFYFGDTYWIHK
jgi:hypothetical protein